MRTARELAAIEALLRLFESAKECRALYDAADLGYPEPLRRLFGPWGHAPLCAAPARVRHRPTAALRDGTRLECVLSRAQLRRMAKGGR
jgi:hypothetical protein